MRHATGSMVRRAVALLMMLAAVCVGRADAASRVLDAEAVRALLSTMDAIANAHPGFQEKTEAYAQMSETDRETAFEAAREQNEANTDVTEAIKALLESEPYRIYFRRFRNVTPEIMRDILLDLPYRQRHASPGGIGGMLYNLIRERQEVRALVDQFLDEVDMTRVQETAFAWVPEGDYDVPTIYLIYDSNAGSFTAKGKPFFNLYSETLFSDMRGDAGKLAVRRAEGTMAHEMQHVLARRHLFPLSRPRTPWDRKWVDTITRGLVSEGAAKHCNPPEGFQKELWEDEEVVSALVNRLNDALLAISTKEMTEDEIQQWYSDNFHEFARGLLRRHLEMDFEEPQLGAMMNKYAPIRPDLEHALGWWMVSRISADGSHPEAVHELLKAPYAVYARYNETIAEDRLDLRIDPQVIAFIASLRTN